MLSNISAISAFNCEEECNCNHHHHDDEAKIFKVAATIGDNNNVDITTIEESFCDPDEIDIIDNDGDICLCMCIVMTRKKLVKKQ